MPSDTLKWFQGYNVKKRIYLVKHLFFFVCSMTNGVIELIKRWSVTSIIDKSQNETKTVELMILHKIEEH